MQGTLLNSKSQISSANARALKEAVSRGVKVVIATGKVRTIEFIDYHDVIKKCISISFHILANISSILLTCDLFSYPSFCV